MTNFRELLKAPHNIAQTQNPEENYTPEAIETKINDLDEQLEYLDSKIQDIPIKVSESGSSNISEFSPGKGWHPPESVIIPESTPSHKGDKDLLDILNDVEEKEEPKAKLKETDWDPW